MIGTIFCAECKATIPLEFNFEELVPGFPEDVESCCPKCKATFSVPVKMDLVIGKPRMVGSPVDQKWLAVKAYYGGRRLENRVEQWAVPQTTLPVQFILSDELWGKTVFQGRPFVTDGYTLLRVSDEASFHCINDNSVSLSSFLQRISDSTLAPAQLVARIVGAGMHGDHVEDYAALKCDDGRIIFLLASHVEAFLSQSPRARFFLDSQGDFAVIMGTDGLCGAIARLEVGLDEDHYDQVNDYLGEGCA